MEKIERGYATIYIDREGETLVDEKLGFWTKEMINDYYVTPGSIQWNYYLIIPIDILSKAKWAFENPDAPTEIELKKLNEKITLDGTYGRKFVLSPEVIELYMLDQFPVQGEESGKVVLLKGVDRKDTEAKLRSLGRTAQYRDYLPIDSFNRDYGSMATLSKLDDLRKAIIRNPHMKIIFFTHIGNEFSWARQKFDFLSPEIIKTYE